MKPESGDGSGEPAQDAEYKKYGLDAQADDGTQQPAQVVTGGAQHRVRKASPVCSLRRQLRRMPWSCFTWPMIGSIACLRLSHRRCDAVSVLLLAAVDDLDGRDIGVDTAKA